MIIKSKLFVWVGLIREVVHVLAVIGENVDSTALIVTNTVSSLSSLAVVCGSSHTLVYSF